MLMIVLKFKRYECYCGNTYGLYGLASNFGLSCDSKCPNNRLEMCGGGDANSVYATGVKCE